MPTTRGTNGKDPHPLEECPAPGVPPSVRPGNRDIFGQIAAWTTRVTGGKWCFLVAVLTVLVWAVSGPFFHYSEMWQLVINTGTTIVTFLMVFLIQNAQNRESKAVHLKLDELIFALRGAKNELIDVESLTEEQLDRIAERYRAFAERYHRSLADSLERAADSVSSELVRFEEAVERVEEKVDQGLASHR